MNIQPDSGKPIFVQIAEGIEDAILTGAFREESQIPSITEFSVNYRINPATALKGISLLVDDNIIYKKRGLGMFVNTGAVSQLKEKRKSTFFENYITTLIKEARRLNLSKEELFSLVEKGLKADASI